MSPDHHTALAGLQAEIAACRICPRLVAWREQVAVDKRAAFRDQEYWGRGVPGFGDPAARIVLVGLAPAAHGANRTGRVFTGDRSGDWLYAALHRAGLASQASSTAADDGLRLTGAYVTAAVRCAPPANKPTPAERDACRPFLERELALLSERRVYIALGAFGYEALSAVIGLRPRPRFGHGVEIALPDGRTLLCSFHPSQQNTFTGRLTEAMLDSVMARAKELAAR
ncbi:MAG TPA: uracil-DNA glycosylase [Acidimicrobiales bacterium]